MPTDELAARLRFSVEADRLKSIERQTWLADGSRRENSAEHSWHVALMALLLAEHSPEPVDPLRVIHMLLLHDLVEIDAGDTFCYDADAHRDKAEREEAAAERLFGLLPHDQAENWRALWQEFEAGETAEARFANALDRLQPLLLNHHSGGGSWYSHEVSEAQVQQRVAPIRDALPAAWPVVEEIIDDGVRRGLLSATPQRGTDMREEPTDLQQHIAEDPGYMAMYDLFEPQPDLTAQIRALQPEAFVVIVCEAWCSDCLRNVPRWTRIAEELPEWRHAVVPREEPYVSRYGVRRIPTIILFDPASGEEIGRIIENPRRTLEEDTLAMLRAYHAVRRESAHA